MVKWTRHAKRQLRHDGVQPAEGIKQIKAPKIDDRADGAHHQELNEALQFAAVPALQQRAQAVKKLGL